jgi:hypothetical protein
MNSAMSSFFWFNPFRKAVCIDLLVVSKLDHSPVVVCKRPRFTV